MIKIMCFLKLLSQIIVGKSIKCEGKKLMFLLHNFNVHIKAQKIYRKKIISEKNEDLQTCG